jgi:hypothetical protein
MEVVLTELALAEKLVPVGGDEAVAVDRGAGELVVGEGGAMR